MTDLRYPTGPFVRPTEVSPADRARWIDEIAALPARFRAAVEDLSDEQLDTPYRPGGWTVRQLTHHVADSHLNAYIRCKWIMTEETPMIKTYDEKAWAEEADARRMPLAPSLDLLDALHARWTGWLRTLPEEAFARTARHPEWGTIRLDTMLALYAWHGRHHTAHATGLREREGWN